jgi:DNA-binding MarR family transcriptional regulator
MTHDITGAAALPEARGTPLPPRWLTEEEQRAWLALNGVLLLLPYALDAQLQADDGLSLFEYGVLSMLSEAPDRRLRMKELAGLSRGSLSRLSHVVSRLEQRGYVRREPLPQDGRTTVAVLTDDGWEKIVSAAPGHVDAVRRFVVDVQPPGELLRLGAACARILDAVTPHCEVPCGPSDQAGPPRPDTPGRDTRVS